ncbi:UvrD-helicase domain-containing protein [Catellatospora sichuanensis]|uniref:UvrD-helicase domain-containing protein n=1 Tax=Catellatospora sichuanensis TaxID=1969805 RepID=UPI0011845465|nr:UvrD-helicase domain-containing protein [Catellatospora sichuanensis]
MQRLAIAKEFLADYAKLQKPVQKAVDAAITRFAEHTHAGLHLEKLNNARDPRIRTIRINQFYRGVVLAPETGTDYLLITVLPHDDAIAYAISHRFTVNQALGVLEVRNQDKLEEVQQTYTKLAAAAPAALLHNVSDADLRRLGIDATVLPLVRVIATDAQLTALAGLLPAVQHDVLTGLAAGMTADEVWGELSERLTATPAAIDADDLLAAAARTPDRFAFVTGPQELKYVLAHPFDAWRIFLHPTQRDIAYQPVYNGPALVTGSAGTGKTITALHRAVHLARQLPAGVSGRQVLVTTFTRNLADALERQLSLLTDDPAILGRIEILNVDRLAHRIFTEIHGRQPRVPDNQAMRHLWETAATTATGVSATFLEREWEQVILAQRLTGLTDYLTAPRRGRGGPVRGDEQRERIWNAVNEVTGKLAEWGQSTHLQLAEEAAVLLTMTGRTIYRHLVVDEGQDLHPAQWRLLRALVPAGPNDMFIVADPHQRIYDSQVSLASLGIAVRGRSRKLKVNYRTTQEILAWSVSVLTGVAPVGLDDEGDNLTGYRSLTHGRRPAVAAYTDRSAETAALVRQVGSWLDKGVEPHAIGVAARHGQLVRSVTETFAAAGIAAGPVTGKGDVVRVGTMHAMKGLEFQCLAVVGVDAATLPARKALADEGEDPIAHRQDLLRERCLLFVACTRARDMLYLSHIGSPSPFLPKV